VPVYQFRCPGCGPFDLRLALQDDTAAASCPACAQPATRSYRVAGTGFGTGALRGASPADRARVDRARSGEPVRTGSPSGRRLSSGGHRH
jgi:putative FmdB family regulatory protein